MRQLLPSEVVDVIDVHDFYARDWLEPGGVRVNFISSVDGAVSVGGLSRGLQTKGDNAVFMAMRDLADVVLVGAGTARTEGYESIHPAAERRAARRKRGVPEVLTTALVSRRLDLDPAADLFTNAEAGARTIAITCAASDATKRAAISTTADVIVAGEHDVDLREARRALEERGLRRILCEGGPHLFADLAAAGVVDELCLSLSNLLAGPGAGRITAGQPWQAGPVGLVLHGLLEEDGALFARYRTAD